MNIEELFEEALLQDNREQGVTQKELNNIVDNETVTANMAQELISELDFN